MSSGQKFDTKKEGAKYFILGKMNSGRQKTICLKKKGEYIKMKARPYKPVQAVQAVPYKLRTSTTVQAKGLYVQGVFFLIQYNITIIIVYYNYY